MNNETRQILKTYLSKYLEIKCSDFSIKNKSKLFKCPFSEEHKNNSDQPSANIFPPNSYKLYCHDPAHGNLGDIFSLVRKFEPDMADLDDDEIANYLIALFEIKIGDEIEKLINLYNKNDFALFPLSPNSKVPIQESKNWQKTAFKNIEEWLIWIKAGNNIALNLGPVSHVVAIDIDSDETYEKIKHLLGDTLSQTTKRGKHFLYKYESDFDSINHANLRNKGYEMELRANNSYIVIAPSSVDGEKRTWNFQPILKMPIELKNFLFDLIEKKNEPIYPQIKNIQDAINTNDLGIKDGLKGLDGCCNETFIKLGGILRKKLNLDQTNYALNIFNQLLAEPMPYKDLKGMIQQISKYNCYDKEELAKQILMHLDIVEEATARDIRDSLRYELKDIEETLDYLLKEKKIYKIRRIYKKIQKAEWREEFVDSSRLINFKMPYFHDYAVFRTGDLIVIGAPPGVGKTHIALNIIKKLVDQGVKPNYISLEAGNRFAQIAPVLDLKEGDFKWCNHYSPETIELEDNATTIIDWLLPNDYAQTDKLYKRFTEQLEKHKGILIIFVQLKKNKDQEGDFFACVDKSTQCFTQNGWKYYWELEENDKILSFNLNNEKLQYQNFNINIYDYNGELDHIQNKYMDQLITPNHKLILKRKYRKGKYGKSNFKRIIDVNWQEIKMKDLKYHETLYFPHGGYLEAQKFLNKYFCELLGWLISEGNLDRNKYIRITQVKKEGKERIKFLLDKLNIKYSLKKKTFYLYKKKNTEIYSKILEYFDDNFKKPHWKLLNLNKENLISLYNGLIQGDGSTTKQINCDQFYQKNKYTVDWFCTLCAMIGYRTVIRKIDTITKINNIKTYIYHIGIYKDNISSLQKNNQKNSSIKISKEKYKGKVWCPTVLNGAWLARRNGKIFITGNSNMIDMFPAFVAKYKYVNNDNENTCFETCKIRESKVGKQIITIPTYYDFQTKRLELRNV